jgi:hypothetical protein
MLALFDPRLAVSLGAPAELVPMPDDNPLDPDGLQSGSTLAPAPQPESGWKRTRRWVLRTAPTVVVSTLAAAIGWVGLRT